jgi:rubrerythrin
VSTRAIDFGKISLRDALDVAVLMEEEAKERYAELADQMRLHHEAEIAAFFVHMSEVEARHESHLTDRRRSIYGSERASVRREQLFDVEAPEYGEVRAGMTAREALEVAMRAEAKAYAFFDQALPQVNDTAVRALFQELRAEEAEHRELVGRRLAQLPKEDDVKGSDYADDPVAH